MIGALVIVLVAATIMLVAGCAVAARRLVDGGRRLRAELERTRDQLQPLIAEFGDQTEVARVESQALQASVAALRAGGRQVRD